MTLAILAPMIRSADPVRAAWPPGTPDVAAGVIEDARGRQLRRRAVTAAAIAVLIAAALIATGTRGLGSGAGSVGAPPAGQTVRAGALTVTLPAGWHWRLERGCYRVCTNPIIRLDLASYRLPAWFGQHQGPMVVPANGVLLLIESVPIRTSATPWKRWRLSNAALKPAHRNGPLDPNRFRAVVDLPGSAAIGASAFLGSIPMPRTALAAANGVLRSLRVARGYQSRLAAP
jgi:hypothetical protein